jgi:hypothetical protein
MSDTTNLGEVLKELRQMDGSLSRVETVLDKEVNKNPNFLQFEDLTNSTRSVFFNLCRKTVACVLPPALLALAYYKYGHVLK